MSLLDKARSFAKTEYDSEELLDLAIAFYSGELTSTQVARTIDLAQASNVVQRLGSVLRNAAIAGKVTIARKRGGK